jgi:hypothetical protein
MGSYLAGADLIDGIAISVPLVRAAGARVAR